MLLTPPSVENANNQKLMAEYEKYQELQARSQKLQEVRHSLLIICKYHQESSYNLNVHEHVYDMSGIRRSTYMRMGAGLVLVSIYPSGL